MNLFEALPDDYQFTGEDMQRHWELFPKCVTPDGPLPTVTQDDLDFYNLTDEADRLSRIIKRLPTMKELREYWKQEAEEQASKRAKIEADWEERKARAAQKSV
jgi:hypothetical protein